MQCIVECGEELRKPQKTLVEIVGRLNDREGEIVESEEQGIW
jgi:hypothetical protein